MNANFIVLITFCLFWILAGNTEGSRTFGRLGWRQKLAENSYDTVHRIHLAQKSVHSSSFGNGIPVCRRKICCLPEQLLTCDVWGSDSSDDEDSRILEDYVVQTGKYLQTFRRSLSETSVVIYPSTSQNWGHALAQLVETLQAGRSQVRFPIVSFEFSLT
jgi:hypothetical protein